MCPSLMTLAYRAKDNGADIALFGHTHEPLCEYAYGVLLLNPRARRATAAEGDRARANVLIIDGDKLRVEDIE